MTRDKDRTKTNEDRLVELCPRALDVLKCKLTLRARLQLAGKIKHADLFFNDDGSPIRNLQYPLWVAKQHGHSVQTMLETYAAWLDGTTESDLRAIKAAMDGTSNRSIREVKQQPRLATGAVTRLSLEVGPIEVAETARNSLAEREGFEPSKGF